MDDEHDPMQWYGVVSLVCFFTWTLDLSAAPRFVLSSLITLLIVSRPCKLQGHHLYRYSP